MNRKKWSLAQKKAEKFKVSEIPEDYLGLEAKVKTATKARDSYVKGCLKHFFLFALIQLFLS